MPLSVVRWLLTLLGGVLLGGGLVLHGQVAMARYMRSEVDGTFFLWRAIGKVTFLFQDEVTRSALVLNDLPPQVLKESDRAAWTLVVIGALLVLAVPFVREGRGRRQSRT